MGRTFSGIDDALRQFIAAQHIFFVGTAPAGPDGHVNISPKGLDTFRVLDDRTVAYLDLVGSGIETVAHLGDNGRICIMFCAFDGPPNIVRLHGQGRAIEPGNPDFASLRAAFPSAPAGSVRAVVQVGITRISSSCGFGVPFYEYRGERPQLHAWAERKGPDGLAAYRRDKNSLSIDGLRGLRAGN